MKSLNTRVLVLLLVLVVVWSATGWQTGAAGLAARIEVAMPELGPAELQTFPNGEVVVSVGEFPQGGRPGDPMLPYKLVRLLVPPDANLATAKAELVSGNWEELPGEHEVAPVPPAASWDGEKTLLSWGTKDTSVIINSRDSTIYSKDAYFPGEPVQLACVGLFRQWKLVEFSVCLAAYNPVKRKVRVLRDARVVLSVEKLPPALATGLNSPTPPVLPGADRFSAELLDRVANPQDLETFYGGLEGASRSTWDYVIITTNTIVTNSNKLDDFISAKEARGYTVKVVTEQETADDTHYVSGSTLTERANNIRSWLQGHYVSDGIEYVLLIGNPTPEPEESAPTLYFSTYEDVLAPERCGLVHRL